MRAYPYSWAKLMKQMGREPSTQLVFQSAEGSCRTMVLCAGVGEWRTPLYLEAEWPKGEGNHRRKRGLSVAQQVALVAKRGESTY